MQFFQVNGVLRNSKAYQITKIYYSRPKNEVVIAIRYHMSSKEYMDELRIDVEHFAAYYPKSNEKICDYVEDNTDNLVHIALSNNEYVLNFDYALQNIIEEFVNGE